MHDHHDELPLSIEVTAAPSRRFTFRVRALDDGAITDQEGGTFDAPLLFLAPGKQ